MKNRTFLLYCMAALLVLHATGSEAADKVEIKSSGQDTTLLEATALDGSTLLTISEGSGGDGYISIPIAGGSIIKVMLNANGISYFTGGKLSI